MDRNLNSLIFTRLHHKQAFAALVENSKEANCSISLSEKPCEDFVKFDVECGEDKKYQWTTGEQRVKRSPQGLGAPSLASQKELDDLQPKLVNAFRDWSIAHLDFPYNFQRIISGHSQIVSGTVYNLSVVVGVHKTGNLVEMEANVVESPEGKIEKITLHSPGNENANKYELTF